MKTLLLATALVTISTAAIAETTTAQIRDVYVTKIVQTPREIKGCHIIDVPIYGTKKASGGEAVTGAIIGGVIGNQFGNGSGKDAMTVLGALIGANAVDNKKEIIGYDKQERCTRDIYYEDKKIRVYSHSIIEFKVDGITYTERFVK